MNVQVHALEPGPLRAGSGTAATELARRFAMTSSAISYAVVRGKEIAERYHYDVISDETN
jgi:hypothetical protein